MDKNLKLKALKRKALKEQGVKSLDIEDAFIELTSLQEKVKDLGTKKRKISGHKCISIILQKIGSYKKRKKLLKALAGLKPVKKSILKKKTESKDVKSLIRDTNKKIKSIFEIKTSLIKSCRDIKLKGYYRLEVSLLLKITGSKS